MKKYLLLIVLVVSLFSGLAYAEGTSTLTEKVTLIGGLTFNQFKYVPIINGETFDWNDSYQDTAQALRKGWGGYAGCNYQINGKLSVDSGLDFTYARGARVLGDLTGYYVNSMVGPYAKVNFAPIKWFQLGLGSGVYLYTSTLKVETDSQAMYKGLAPAGFLEGSFNVPITNKLHLVAGVAYRLAIVNVMKQYDFDLDQMVKPADKVQFDMSGLRLNFGVQSSF